MDFLGIGPLEIFTILVIALLALGPKGLMDSAGKLGGMWRKFRMSSVWQAMMGSRQAVNKMASELIETTELDEIRAELAKARIPSLDDKDLAERLIKRRNSMVEPQPPADEKQTAPADSPSTESSTQK